MDTAAQACAGSLTPRAGRGPQAPRARADPAEGARNGSRPAWPPSRRKPMTHGADAVSLTGAHLRW